MNSEIIRFEVGEKKNSTVPSRDNRL
jgi:hypothetical protein